MIGFWILEIVLLHLFQGSKFFPDTLKKQFKVR